MGFQIFWRIRQISVFYSLVFPIRSGQAKFLSFADILKVRHHLSIINRPHTPNMVIWHLWQVDSSTTDRYLGGRGGGLGATQIYIQATLFLIFRSSYLILDVKTFFLENQTSKALNNLRLIISNLRKPKLAKNCSER